MSAEQSRRFEPTEASDGRGLRPFPPGVRPVSSPPDPVAQPDLPKVGKDANGAQQTPDADAAKDTTARPLTVNRAPESRSSDWFQPKAVVNKETGLLYEIPQATIDAIATFKVPIGFKRAGAASESFIYSLGVYVEPTAGNEGGTPTFFCMASAACRNMKHEIACKGAQRSNVNKHLRSKHKLVGAHGHAVASSKAEPDFGMSKALDHSKHANSGRGRSLEVAFALLIMEKMLPFDFSSAGDNFRRMMELTTSDFPIMSAQRVKHVLVEIYHATKQAVAGKLAEEVKASLLPIVHFTMGVWTCPTSQRKFLTTHLFYVDREFQSHGFVAGVKHFSPSASLHDGATASEVLLKIFEANLADFGLSFSDLASGTTDIESIAKTMCEDRLRPLGVQWDHCCAHVASEACTRAFGVTSDDSQSKNRESLELIRLVMKTCERIRRFPSMKAHFDDLELDTLSEILTAKKHAPQRWLTLVNTLARIIRMWHPLRKVYTLEREAFPLDSPEVRQAVLELFSLMAPVAAITRDGQRENVPMTAEIHLAFAMLKIFGLDPTQPLKVFQIPDLGVPIVDKDAGTLSFKMVKTEDLQSVTKRIRVELNKALITGFYARFWDESSSIPSVVNDMAVLLTPPFNTGNHFKALKLITDDTEALVTSSATVTIPTTDEQVRVKEKKTWDRIREVAIEAARAREEKSSGDKSPASKRARLSPTIDPSATSPAPVPRPSSSQFAFLGRDASESQHQQDVDLIASAVDSDLKRYKALAMDPAELKPTDVLSYWSDKGRFYFQTLTPVAQQVFGKQVSAAHGEPDLSAAGLKLSTRKSRSDTYWTEMLMFLNLNKSKIPDIIPQIPPKSIKKYLPARFAGMDRRLTEAEDAIDKEGAGLMLGEDVLDVGSV